MVGKPEVIDGPRGQVLVICCHSRAEETLAGMRDTMMQPKLTVNETKTRVCKLPEEKFDFLGYTVLFAEDGTCAPSHRSCTEVGKTHLQSDQ